MTRYIGVLTQQDKPKEGVVAMLDDFINMLFAKSDDIIRKSKGVYYTPDGGDPTAVAYHPDHYGENLARHHPFDVDYGNIDPATGEYATLTHHPAGMHGNHVPKGGIPGFEHAFGSDENGHGRVLWPIEAAVKGIVDFIQKKQYAQDQHGRSLIGQAHDGIGFDYHLAMEAVQEAVEDFNKQHTDPKHHLPNVVAPGGGLNPEWGQVNMGAFPKNEEGNIHDSSVMPTRDENGKLITFYLNSGTAMGEPERGPYPESGAIPFFKQLKDRLNQKLGPGMAMNFVHQPYIEPHMMNPQMSREASTEGQRGKRTMTAAQEAKLSEESHYGAIAPEMLVEHHPDAFFHVQQIGQKKGGRPSPKSIGMIQDANAVMGLGLSEGQINHLANAPIAQLLTAGQKISDQGKYMGVYNQLGQHTGLHPGAPMPLRRWKKGKEGMHPEELSAAYAEYKNDPTQWEMGVGEFADSHEKHHSQGRRHGGAGYGQGTISTSRKALGLIGGAHENGIDLNHAWHESGGEDISPGTPNHTNAQAVRAVFSQIAQHRIANSPELQALRPIDFAQGHPESALQTPSLPREWMSVPGQHVMATHAAVQPVQQQQAAPQGQTTLDDWAKPELFQSSVKEYSEAESRLLKAMETIQMDEARKNPMVIKLLPRQSMNINSYDDLLIMSNRINLTPQDIVCINQTQGDWDNIAKTLSVAPDVVCSVKVAFGE